MMNQNLGLNDRVQVAESLAFPGQTGIITEITTSTIKVQYGNRVGVYSKSKNTFIKKD